MKKTAGQKTYERFCKEFGHKASWDAMPETVRSVWERIGVASQTEDDPNEPPGAGN